MWSETVGLRTRPETQNSVLLLALYAVVLVLILHTAVLILFLQVWYCFVKKRSCHARPHNDLERQSTIYSHFKTYRF